MPKVRSLSPAEALAAVPALADVLIDCVHSGASVGFMAPLSRATAEEFWRGVASGVAAGSRILLVAEVDERIAGTVQVVFAGAENQPHRADIAKMLVHGSARRRGLGAALLQAAEAEAKRAGRSVLVLDTHAGSAADHLYASHGWVRVGIIPNYALMPVEGYCDTMFFYRHL
ncbi:MAG: GNAT family N-acetyltransferase [Hyphomicrobiaceae bacterium]